MLGIKKNDLVSFLIFNKYRKMRKTVILILGIFILASCGNTGNKSNDTEPLKSLGSDKDEHGCINSAGYTWSIIKQECIRVWETGNRLNPIDEKETTSAFVVFNADKSKLELFLPNAKSTVILPLLDKGNYGTAKYMYNENNLALTIDGVVKYRFVK